MEPMVTKTKSRIYQEFAARLHKACDKANLPKIRGRATALGHLMKISYKGAGKWLDGEGMPDMGHSTALAVKLDVSFEWLMTGRGAMNLSTQFLHAAEETTGFHVRRNELEIIAQHMPTAIRELTLKYIEMLQEIMEQRPELLACPKSEREAYKLWEADFQRLKAKEMTRVVK